MKKLLLFVSLFLMGCSFHLGRLDGQVADVFENRVRVRTEDDSGCPFVDVRVGDGPLEVFSWGFDVRPLAGGEAVFVRVDALQGDFLGEVVVGDKLRIYWEGMIGQIIMEIYPPIYLPPEIHADFVRRIVED